MANMIQDGLVWLAGELKDHASETVSYSRQGLGTVSNLAATMGQTAFRTQDDRHSRLEWADADFTLKAADLVINAQTILPKSGDRITWGSQVYEVQPFNGEQCYRRCDPFGIRLRIHTKRVQ